MDSIGRKSVLGAVSGTDSFHDADEKIWLHLIEPGIEQHDLSDRAGNRLELR